MLLKLVWIEIFQNKKFTVLFLVNLMIGLLGFSTLDGFKRSFADKLQLASKNLLTSDLTIAARRDLQDKELETIKDTLGPDAALTQSITLYSMAASTTRSSLVELKVIEDRYPFYGQITLSDNKIITSSSDHELNQTQQIWVSPEILIQFKVVIGDSLKIGSQDFLIAHVIEDDTGANLAGSGYAPRIYLGKSQLASTELMTKGSTAWRTLHVKLDRIDNIETIEKNLFDKLDNTIRVESFKKSGQDNGRMLRYLTDYLGLVSLVALFLSGIGTFYLFRSYIVLKQREIAVLLTLGLSATKATSLYLIQLVFLGCMSSLLTALISAFLLPLFTEMLSNFSPIVLELGYSYQTFIATFLIGSLTPLFLCLPLLLEVSKIKPSQLFQEYSNPTLSFSKRKLLGFVPALLAGIGLAIWQSHSYLVGSLFSLAMIGASLLILLCGLALLKALDKSPKTSLVWNMVCTYLNGHKTSTLSCFLALSLSSLLINLIPQIETALLQEIKRPVGEKLPSLFVFDIQEGQDEEIKDIVSNSGNEISFMSPMIRARLTHHNGDPASKGQVEDNFSRESERAQRMKNRGVNLSYRSELQSSEKIVDGKPFSGPYTGDFHAPGELSLEARYAERMDFHIGDTLTFDIQGLPVVGQIVNLRSVKWNSFQPNFFVQFQPGYIDDAPKTFIAALPALDFQTKIDIQNKIVEAMPNISIVDVSKVVEKLTEIIAQMSSILKIMAWLSVLAGLVVTFSIANHQAQQRLWDINLLKILGASFATVQKIILQEFLILSISAGLLGSLTSMVISGLITAVLFDGIWLLDLASPLWSMLWIVALCLLISQAASIKVLRAKPRFYL